MKSIAAGGARAAKGERGERCAVAALGSSRDVFRRRGGSGAKSHGIGLGKDVVNAGRVVVGYDARQLDIVGRGRRYNVVLVVRARRGQRAGRAGHGRSKGWRSVGTGRSRGCPLAATTSMGELVVVQTASELSLVEVGGDVLVGHLLETSAKKICFLYISRTVRIVLGKI